MNKPLDDESLFLAQLGQRVRTMRALHGMSRRVLSHASGVSERYIAQLESGEGNASVILLRRISHAMGARLEDLIDASEHTPDWTVVRELLAHASQDQITAVKAQLTRADTGPARGQAQRIAL